MSELTVFTKYRKFLFVYLISATVMLSEAAHSGTIDPDATIIDVIQQAGALQIESEYVQLPNSFLKLKDRAIESTSDVRLVNRAFFGGLDLFGVDEYMQARYLAAYFPDPWLFFQYELNNLSEFSVFYALDIWMPTNVTSGPTQKDTFLDLTLIDSNDDDSVFSRSTTASFTVIDDTGGATINGQDTLGQTPPPGSAFFQGETTHTLFDVVGTGPDSDGIEGASGFNYIRFLMNGYLSGGDTLLLTGLGCYGGSAAICPDRNYLRSISIDTLSVGDTGSDTGAAPLPAPWEFAAAFDWYSDIYRPKDAETFQNSQSASQSI